jgi:hypothetical protein
MHRQRAGGTAIAAALVLAAVAPPFIASARTGRFFDQADTRTLALRYVESHIPAGASLALQPYSVPVVQSRESLVESLSANLGDASRAPFKVAMRLALDPYPQPAYRLIYLGDGGLDEEKIYVGYGGIGGGNGLQPLRQRNVQFVLLKRPVRPDENVQRLAGALAKEAERMAVFYPYAGGESCSPGCPEPFLHNLDARIDARLERPGPVIEVWRILP